jgi:hypothetical protein
MALEIEAIGDASGVIERHGGGTDRHEQHEKDDRHAERRQSQRGEVRFGATVHH